MKQWKKKILFLAPHLSTGGMPAFLLKRIEALRQVYEIFVVEHRNFSNEYPRVSGSLLYFERRRS